MHDGAAVSEELVLAEQLGGGVTGLTLNRPGARNALSLQLIGELHRKIGALSSDPAVAAIVIDAVGPAFSAGHDLKELTSHRGDADEGRAFFEKTVKNCSALMQAIVNCPKPVIAAVEARATAAGCQLVASCDLAVASEAADFATPGVNIGLFCSTPMIALTRNIAPKRAMEMLLLGEPIDASTARDFGLVNRVVPNGTARQVAIEIARRIAGKSKVTVAIGKTAFYRQLNLPLADAYDYAAEVMVENMLKADACEGISAFVEKRHPSWTDA